MRLANPGVFVYVRHGTNAWRECTPGSFLYPTGWQRIDRPFMLSETVLATYRAAAGST